MAKKKIVKKNLKKTTTKKKVSRKKTSVKKATKRIVKSTKKRIVKKNIKKTTVKQRKTVLKKNILVAVSPDKYFWIQYGPAVKDILGLKNALLDIKNEQFKHHVNSMKNDFAVWIEEVIEDERCAEKIKKAKTLKAMIKVLENTLKRY